MHPVNRKESTGRHAGLILTRYVGESIIIGNTVFTLRRIRPTESGPAAYVTLFGGFLADINCITKRMEIGESIQFGDIVIQLLNATDKQQASIRIEAPRNVHIRRDELKSLAL